MDPLVTTTTTCPVYSIIPCGNVKNLNIQYNIPYSPDEFEVEYGFVSEWPLNTTLVNVSGPGIPNPIVIQNVNACEQIKVKLTPICDDTPGTAIEQLVTMSNIPTLKITPIECDSVTGIQSFLIEKYNTTTSVQFKAKIEINGNIVWDNDLTRTCNTGAWIAAKIYDPVLLLEEDVVSPLVTSTVTPTVVNISTISESFIADSLILYTHVVAYNIDVALSSITTKLIITEINGITINPSYEVSCSSCYLQTGSEDLECLTPLPSIGTPSP